ncbi:MAG: SpoIVB peptidase [Clostridia bacterium]|nr:SpoIVB peptidase [Clostridia bacterium]
MKKRKILLSVILLTILTASACRIGFICYSVPDKIYIMEGEEYRFDKYHIFSNLFSVSSAADTSGALSREGRIDSSGTYTANIQLLNIPVKTVNVNVIDKPMLIPCGTPIGIKLYADGLEIIGSESFVNSEGVTVNPAEAIPFRKGDVITEVNGIRVKTIQEFSKEMSKNKDNTAKLTVSGRKNTYTASVTPHIDSGSHKFRIGLIVRDSIAGIGTLTYHNPADNTFGALGHAIEDSDTDIIFPLSRGSVEEASILSVSKGKKGVPGEIHGMFTGRHSMGNITVNCPQGIFGTFKNSDSSLENAIPVAAISETKEGKAHILCTVNDEGTQKYDIEIEKILHMSSDTSKGMVIKITDSKLLATTGGIVQGMSGSPIIQNGKIVGAVTHVFVNDPTRGYGIFIENMLAEAEKIK